MDSRPLPVGPASFPCGCAHLQIQSRPHAVAQVCHKTLPTHRSKQNTKRQEKGTRNICLHRPAPKPPAQTGKPKHPADTTHRQKVVFDRQANKHKSVHDCCRCTHAIKTHCPLAQCGWTRHDIIFRRIRFSKHAHKRCLLEWE